MAQLGTDAESVRAIGPAQAMGSFLFPRIGIKEMQAATIKHQRVDQLVAAICSTKQVAGSSTSSYSIFFSYFVLLFSFSSYLETTLKYSVKTICFLQD